MSPCTENVVLFCIASIYYHFNYLQNILPKDNPLWSSCVMMDRNEEVMSMVRISYPWEMCERHCCCFGHFNCPIYAFLLYWAFQFPNLCIAIVLGISTSQHMHCHCIGHFNCPIKIFCFSCTFQIN